VNFVIQCGLLPKARAGKSYQLRRLIDCLTPSRKFSNHSLSARQWYSKALSSLKHHSGLSEAGSRLGTKEKKIGEIKTKTKQYVSVYTCLSLILVPHYRGKSRILYERCYKNFNSFIALFPSDKRELCYVTQTEKSSRDRCYL